MVLQDNETALHCASFRGHIECVQSLLEIETININATDQVFFFKLNHFERVEYLVILFFLD